MTRQNELMPEVGIAYEQRENESDVVVVGGGMVGMASALALASIGYQVQLLESGSSPKKPSTNDTDQRTLVCNPASIEFWNQLGVWSHLVDSSTSINRVLVMIKDHFGTVEFSADELAVKDLARVVSAQQMAYVLAEMCQDDANINYLSGADYISHDGAEDGVLINFQIKEKKQQIKTQLMIAADGVLSPIRKELGVATKIKSYQKSAIVCQMSAQQSHQNCAFEYLTEHGPTAVIPFENGRCGFVYCAPTEQVDILMQLNDDDFIMHAQDQFGYRLGQLSSPSKRMHFPLYQVYAEQQSVGRVLLLGNSAHSMSPVSAQGLNLAVRDINRLLRILEFNQEKTSQPRDPGDAEMLKNYIHASDYDQKQTLQYTDDLMRLFEIQNGPIGFLRSMAMLAVDNNTSIKKKLFTRAAGYREH